MKNKILIVEDNIVNRNVLRKMLVDIYDLQEAVNGKEALAIVKKDYREISAIILDLFMPVMDGRELLGLLSGDETYKNIPVLVATGEHDNKIERECLLLGAWDFITKPYDPYILKLRLENIIGRSQTQLLRQIRVLAERDQLTGLYNRRFFMKKTREMLEENIEKTFVMVRMDIDQFRLYNASFGSDEGDELLREIADGVKNWINRNHIKHCTYGRMESDIFGVCIPYNKETLEQELWEAEELLQSLRTDYRLKASFGLYVIQNTDTDMEKIYAHSAEAVRLCKNNQNCIFAYYGSSMGEQEEKAQKFTNEMKNAIKEKQFQIYLQPKFIVQSNGPCGAEALVRWVHPEWGRVSPGEFIPVFEKNGLIVQLDYYMWEESCALLKRWKEEGRYLYPVSVNISRISMYNPQIVDQLVELTERYQVERQYLNLEITESAYMTNPDLMKDIICRLRKKGFIILMDDFGSGYSSLNTLKDIEVDILKIDMNFLPTGKNNVKSEKILVSIIRMASWLGIPVIVEGVETLEQKEFLESIGCNYIQGFFYARPMPVADYERMLDEQETANTLLSETSVGYLREYDAIWSSDTATAALIKSISVPYLIFEYADSQFDVLRVNQSYQDVFAVYPLEKYLFHDEYYKLLTVMDEVVLTKKNKECECLFIMDNGISRWYQIRIAFMGMTDKTSLLSATFADVTAEKKLENELNAVFSALHNKRKEKSSLLVIDDMEISRAVVRALFEEEYNILEADSGQEGLDLLAENYYNIAAVLLDMMMPGMDGREFLYRKNKMRDAANIPVIVVSAERNPDVQSNMLQNGVNDYITKPFLPALLKKRLENVLDYNERFQKLVNEYQRNRGFHRADAHNINLRGYSREDLRQMTEFLGDIFDVVRLVDPRETAVIRIEPDGSVKREKYSCFKVWGRDVRCENCSSMCAMNGQCTVNKVELLRKDLFYVVSQPVTVTLDKEPEHIILEVVSRVTSEMEGQLNGDISDFQFIENIQEKIYRDPLTKAFNRRYLDEAIFLYYKKNQISMKIAFIFFDIYQFKQINDLFGHQTGDDVLRNVVVTLQKQIRKSDAVVRYGGDEFVIILTDCDEEEIQVSQQRFRKAIATVKYGSNRDRCVEADFGAAYTDHFEPGGTMLADMLKEADHAMYLDKKDHKEREQKKKQNRMEKEPS